MSNTTYTTDEFSRQYYILCTSPDAALREKANKYILEFQAVPAAWVLARDLLLNQSVGDMQFFGAQILHRKIKLEFNTLTPAEQIDLKDFIFNSINQGTKKIEKLAFKQLCSCGSLIGTLTISKTWPAFIQDIVNFATLNEENLYAGLEILENIEGQLDSIPLEQKTLILIKSLFQQSMPQIIQLFNFVLEKYIANPNRVILQKLLEAIKGWVRLKLDLLGTPQLVDNLIKLLETEDYFIAAIEIFNEGVQYSNNALILESAHIDVALKTIPNEVKQTLIKLIEFLVRAHGSFLKQLNSEQSRFCRYYTELCNNIGVYFSIFILDKNAYSEALLKLLTICTSHINRKISYLAFDFWNTFRGDLSKYANIFSHPDYQYFIDAYIEVYKIVLAKCRLPAVNLPQKYKSNESVNKNTKIYNVETNQEEEWDDDSEFNLDSSKDYMTLSEYRQNARDVFYAFYNVLTTLRRDQSVEIFLTIILPKIKQDLFVANLMNTNEVNQLTEQQLYQAFIIEVEAVIYSIVNMLDNFDIYKHVPLLTDIITMILDIPSEEILDKSLLELIEQANTQIKFVSNETYEKIFKFVLRNMQNPKICTLASLCFLSICEEGKACAALSILKIISDYIASNIYAITNDGVVENIIQGYFNLAVGIKDNQLKIEFISRIVNVAENKSAEVKSLLESVDQSKANDSTMLNQIIKYLSITSRIIEAFDLDDSDSRSKIFEIVGTNFVTKNIELFCACMQIFKHSPRIVNISVRILRHIINLCEKHLIQVFDLILNSALVVFEANPIGNSQAISLLSSLLFTSEYYEPQINWIQNNYQNLLKFIITKTSDNADNVANNNKKDPDLLRYFVQLQNKTFEKYRDFLLNLNEFDDIIQFIIVTFMTISEITLQKEILIFFLLIFGTKTIITHPKILKNIPNFIEAMFNMLPEIFRRSSTYVTEAFAGLIESFEGNENELYPLFLLAMQKNPKYNIFDQAKQKLIVDTMFKCKKELKSFRVILNIITCQVNQEGTPDDFIQIELMLHATSTKKR